MEYRHKTVLLHEAVEQLMTDPDGIYMDCTLGGAGHTALLLSLLSPSGRVIGVDRDETAIRHAEETLKDDRLILCKSNYTAVDEIVRTYAPQGLNGILADLGVSSPQLDDPERGFSYASDARLDMRMDREQTLSAWEVVNTYPKEDLIRILRDYGEERYAGRIAEHIVFARAKAPIDTTSQLTSVVTSAMPKQDKSEGHPCKRTFQAIRIEVNSELSGISELIEKGIPCLKKGGRMVIISFHSLEDRIVKNAFHTAENPCTCPKDFPVCVCGKKPTVRVLTRKPVLPGDEEVRENNRAHSAKMRVCEKITDFSYIEGNIQGKEENR